MPTSFVSLLNSVGVAFVRNNRYQDGLKHYESALQYVDQDVMQARLAFNMGLGFLRWKKKDEALQWFEKSAKLGGNAFAKAQGYVERLSSGSSLPAVDFEKVAMSEVPDLAVPSPPVVSLDASDDSSGDSLTKMFDAVPTSSSSGNTQLGTTDFGFDADSFLSGGDEPLGSPAPTTTAAAPQFARIEERKKSGETLDAETIRIQSMMLHLVMADKTLFKSTAQMQLKSSHEAYSGTFDGKKVAVFVPNTHAPQLLTRPENIELLRKKVFVLEKVGNVWKAVWPRSVAEKASA